MQVSSSRNPGLQPLLLLQVSIGKQLKSVLDLEPTTRLGFTTHVSHA